MIDEPEEKAKTGESKRKRKKKRASQATALSLETTGKSTCDDECLGNEAPEACDDPPSPSKGSTSPALVATCTPTTIPAWTPSCDMTEDPQVVSDDECIGSGTLKQAQVDGDDDASDVSCTAPSTPVSHTPGWPRRRREEQRAVPNLAMQPRSLVCYIWNQTSQFAHGGSDSPRSASAGRAMHLETPSQSSTPGGGPSGVSASPSKQFSRGCWMSTSLPGTPIDGHPAVVVQNTFLSLVEPEPQPPSRSSRSLSPSCYTVTGPPGTCFDQLSNHWDHWHI